jgi:hypothetical protein
MRNPNPRIYLFLGVLPILSFSLVFLVSCQSQSAKEEMGEKAIEKVYKTTPGKDAKVEIEGGKVTIQIIDGTRETAVTSEWPKDMPGDVPQFRLGKIKGVNRGNVTKKKSWNVLVNDIEEGAYTKYVKELKAAKWKILSSTSIGGGGSVAAHKKDLNLIATFYKDQKTGSISISQKSK